MATRIQENFPLQRLDIFSHPTQDDYERAKDKARQLLRSILPERSWSELEDKGVIQIEGKRGNPVLWSRRFFPELMAVEGDVGARHLIGQYAEAVVEVPVSGKAVLTDVDTPEALKAAKSELERR